MSSEKFGGRHLATKHLEPVGFPGCAGCSYRFADEPSVCLECFRSAELTAPAGSGASQALPFPRPRCAVCGQPIAAGERCTNRWCGRADRYFSSAYPVGTYQGALRRAICEYKYNGQRWWSGVFARLLAGMLETHATWFEEYDLLVPVPSFTGPGARRRWSPVGEMFSELLENLGGSWDGSSDLVQKVSESVPLTTTSAWRRSTLAETSLRRSLVVPQPESVRGRRIIVVDDVFTEGSTLREVARVLILAGAEEVAGIVLARQPWADRGLQR